MIVNMQSVLGVNANTVAATSIATVEVFQNIFPFILLDFRSKIKCICEYLM